MTAPESAPEIQAEIEKTREHLGQPVEERIVFAGEACSAHAFSTAHGAYETGVAAAETVLAWAASD